MEQKFIKLVLLRYAICHGILKRVIIIMAEIVYDIEKNTFLVDGKLFMIEEKPSISQTHIQIGVCLEDDNSRIVEAQTIAEEIGVKFQSSKETATIISVTNDPDCASVITYIEMKIDKPLELIATF
jgi:Tfp pilus assembly protein PilZ